MPIRVILADDHNILRAGLKSLLESFDGIDVIGEANNGRDTIALARKLDPDIIVMDVAMPDMNGVDATQRIAQLTPGIKVLALSAHSDGVYVRGMLEAGAKGYLLKDAATAELETAIRSVANGKIYVSPSVTDTLVGDYLLRVKGTLGPDSQILSPREREVLQLVTEGKSSSQIAATLHLSDRTVESHRKRIMDKLDLRSIAELTKYAVRHGITSIEK